MVLTSAKVNNLLNNKAADKALADVNEVWTQSEIDDGKAPEGADTDSPTLSAISPFAKTFNTHVSDLQQCVKLLQSSFKRARVGRKHSNPVCSNGYHEL